MGDPLADISWCIMCRGLMGTLWINRIFNTTHFEEDINFFRVYVAVSILQVQDWFRSPERLLSTEKTWSAIKFSNHKSPRWVITSFFRAMFWDIFIETYYVMCTSCKSFSRMFGILIIIPNRCVWCQFKMWEIKCLNCVDFVSSVTIHTLYT